MRRVSPVKTVLALVVAVVMLLSNTARALSFGDAEVDAIIPSRINSRVLTDAASVGLRVRVVFKTPWTLPDDDTSALTATVAGVPFKVAAANKGYIDLVLEQVPATAAAAVGDVVVRDETAGTDVFRGANAFTIEEAPAAADATLITGTDAFVHFADVASAVTLSGANLDPIASVNVEGFAEPAAITARSAAAITFTAPACADPAAASCVGIKTITYRNAAGDAVASSQLQYLPATKGLVEPDFDRVLNTGIEAYYVFRVSNNAPFKAFVSTFTGIPNAGIKFATTWQTTSAQLVDFRITCTTCTAGKYPTVEIRDVLAPATAAPLMSLAVNLYVPGGSSSDNTVIYVVVALVLVAVVVLGAIIYKKKAAGAKKNNANNAPLVTDYNQVV